MNKLNIILRGIVKDNPTFVLVLGMCPTLGTTTSAMNGMGMGVATMAVLTMSNMVISLIKNLIPDKVRIPAFIVVIASFVTIIQMLMQAYVPSLYASLGVFIPLIVVNCIILGRAEAFASKNSPVDSIMDGIGIGIGKTDGIVYVFELVEHDVALDGRDVMILLPRTEYESQFFKFRFYKFDIHIFRYKRLFKDSEIWRDTNYLYENSSPKGAVS